MVQTLSTGVIAIDSIDGTRTLTLPFQVDAIIKIQSIYDQSLLRYTVYAVQCRHQQATLHRTTFDSLGAMVDSIIVGQYPCSDTAKSLNWRILLLNNTKVALVAFDGKHLLAMDEIECAVIDVPNDITDVYFFVL